MSDRPVEPYNVAQEVEQYVYGELADAKQYDNRTPLDESGIWSLHTLAARIYAMGWRDGMAVGESNENRARSRERDRSENSSSPGITSGGDRP